MRATAIAVTVALLGLMGLVGVLMGLDCGKRSRERLGRK